MRRMMSQAAALPTQVLISSTRPRTRWTLINAGPCGARRTAGRRPPPTPAGEPRRSAELLGGAILSEIVVEGHAPLHDRVLLPSRRPLGELELRLQDLLEQGILLGFLGHHLVVNLELALQD